MAGRSGLQTVFEENRERLLRFLTARTGNAALAQDLLQDAWIKLDRAAPSGPVADPVAYLYRLCENAARDAARSEQRRLARDTLWTDSRTGFEAQKADHVTPEQVAIERDRLRRLLEELERLPARTRAIFIAYRVEGESQKDIAAAEGISLSAVEKHLQRAYRLVQDIRAREDAGDE